MKLHEDRYAFLTIINLIHEISGIRSDILEKDYYTGIGRKTVPAPGVFQRRHGAI